MKTISIVWSTNDILAKAEQLCINITENQADKLLDIIKHYHDAEVGINWDVISSYLFQFDHEASIDYKLN